MQVISIFFVIFLILGIPFLFYRLVRQGVGEINRGGYRLKKKKFDKLISLQKNKIKAIEEMLKKGELVVDLEKGIEEGDMKNKLALMGSQDARAEIRATKKAIGKVEAELRNLYTQEVLSNPKAQTYLYLPFTYKHRYYKIWSMFQKLLLLILLLFVPPKEWENLKLYLGSAIILVGLLFAAAQQPFADGMETIMEIGSHGANAINVFVALLITYRQSWIVSLAGDVLLFAANLGNLILVMYTLILTPVRNCLFASKHAAMEKLAESRRAAQRIKRQAAITARAKLEAGAAGVANSMNVAARSAAGLVATDIATKVAGGAANLGADAASAASTAGDIMGESSHKAGVILASGADKTWNLARDGVITAVRVAPSVANAAGTMLGDAVGAAKNAMEKGADVTSTAAEKMADGIHKVAKNVENAADDGLEIAENKAGQGMDIAGNAVGEGAKVAGNAMRDAEKIAETAAEMGSQRVGSAAREVTKVAGTLHDGVSSASQQLAGSEIGRQVGEYAAQGASNGARIAADVGSKTISSAGEAASRGASATADAARKVSKFSNEAVSGGIAHQASHAMEAATKATSGVGEAVLGGSSDVLNGASKVGTSIANNKILLAGAAGAVLGVAAGAIAADSSEEDDWDLEENDSMDDGGGASDISYYDESD